MVIKWTGDEHYKITLTGKDILMLLRSRLDNIPDSARVEFDVPGCGDYSNMTLNIDNDTPVVITW